MREYVLMTDSCCDLPDQMAKDLQLEVLPLTMHMDGQDYPNTLDGAAISNEEFYRRIRAGKMATTSAVNVGQFEDAMSAILEQGKDILCISFSSALSTTYQSACIAAETVLAKHPEGRIRVIDSLSASLGQGLLMYLTAHKKLEENLTLDQLGDWVEENKLHVCHWFTVDDLNYLKKGGRVSAATALVGTMLSIKPIMHTSDEGKLTVVGKARGRKSSLNTLVDTVGRLGINLQDQVMFICQADCQAEEILARLRRGEIPRINVSDISFSTRSMIVRGKGSKQRLIPMGEKTCAQLLDYRLRFRHSAGSSEPFFVDQTGGRCSDNLVKLVCQRLKEQTGIERLHPHLLRHTFATYYLADGGDLETLRLILGHSSIHTTQMYLHLAFNLKLQRSRHNSHIDKLYENIV